jgi:hypothetical protein
LLSFRDNGDMLADLAWIAWWHPASPALEFH